MREQRVPVTEIVIGEYVVRVGDRPIGKYVAAVSPVPAGQTIRGPRGGSYRVLDGNAYVRLDTPAGPAPIVRRTATAVVLRDTGDE